MKEKRVPFVIVFALAAVVAAAYYPALFNDFVNYDDDLYVTDNPQVQAGLTWAGVAWSFEVGHVSNWHPLTWLSHRLDCEAFGLDPRGHHLSSLLLHLANTVLLFVVLRRLTGADWKSGLVAALFALHPLNVESVAWVSERKNVVSTTFWLLAMWAYAGYAARRSVWRYLGVTLLLALGLMAKPMLVTLPCVLLLLDYWPLGRVTSRRSVRSLVLEKIPLFALAAASCVVTILAQGGAVATLAEHSAGVRVANALVSYLRYLEQTLWPFGLSAYYPHPGDAIAWWRVLAAVVTLALVSALVFVRRARQPYLVTGWLWYLGTLVPVIGLVQVGTQAGADRYVYVPLIGLFIAVVWGVADLLPQRFPRRRALLGTAGLAVVAGLGVRSWHQTHYWRDSVTLFSHALDVTTGNAVAHNNVGEALVREGRHRDALSHFEDALRIDPRDAHLKKQVRANLARTLAELGEYAAAAEHYQGVLADHPDDVDLRCGLGVVLASQGRDDQAIEQFQEAIGRDPRHADSHYNLGLVFANQGRPGEACIHFRRALAVKPDDVRFLTNLGTALAQRGMIDEAILHLSRAVEIDPDHATARRNLALIQMRREQGR